MKKIRVTVDALCAALDRATLRGSREDWGRKSEALYEMYEALRRLRGKNLVRLPQFPTAPDVVRAVRTQKVRDPAVTEGLELLASRLTSPLALKAYVLP